MAGSRRGSRWWGAQACVLAAAVAAAAPAGGHDPQVRMRVEGSGPRTVIFESGLGDTLEVWRQVQPRVAAGCARTVSYDRAGYSGSDPAESTRDAANIVAELRAALARRGIRPPYVLVGHSLGGLYMQYFARNYPRDVAGLVLVDSSNWNQRLPLVPSAAAVDPPGDPPPPRGSRMVIVFMPWIMRREIMGSAAAGAEVHASPPAAGLPTVILSSTRRLQGETPAGQAREVRLQNDLAREFPGAQHIRVPRSGHYIQRDRPDVVVAAVRKLAGCSPAGLTPLRSGRKKGAPAGR
ncbi:MAG TPA: alpha/beta hydrolase [Steroidobacteraceae bacterium]|nr:alpha/beta hydrolase [Steroidobacteraceae bacterium]